MVTRICRHWTSASCLIAATWLLATNAVVECRDQSPGPVTVFGEETVWRYHVVLREPVVGTARQPAANQTVGENWILRNEDFSSAPPVGNWTAPNFDDSQWLSQKGPIYGGYGSERPVKAEPPAQLKDRFGVRIRSLTVDIPNKRLQKGPNTLAVELHRTAIPPDLPEEGRGAWDTAGMVALDLTAASRAGFATEAELAGTKVWVVNPLLPVDATTLAPDVLAGSGRIEIAAPLGGFAAGQICAGSLQGVRGLKVIPSDLVASTCKIPASHVRVRYARFSYKLPALVDRPVDGAPLVPIWLTFQVPEDAVPGKYSGSVRLDGLDKPVTVPVELTVYG